MIIDIHCHHTFTRREAEPGERFSFEPAVENGRPALDSCLAPRVLHRPFWRLAQRFLGFDPRLQPGPELDEAVGQWYARELVPGGPIERFVLLAFDRYHDQNGRRPPLPESRGQLGSDMYVSNSFVRAACRRHPEKFLFGASVHPYRENAVACIDEVFAAGACVLKWIPLHQNIDARDPRTIAVLRRCGEIGLPLLIHYGPEFTLDTQHREFQPVMPMLDVLRDLRRDGCMPTVICAHVATPVFPWGDRTSHHALTAALLGEFADAPLYADVSALTAGAKLPFLHGLARRQELHAKFLFGSDFPVPVSLPLLRLALGSDYRRIAAEPSSLQRAALILRRLGYSDIVFHRAATLLPHVDFFAPARVCPPPF